MINATQCTGSATSNACDKRTQGEEAMFSEDEARTYSVVINHEEQYSIWLANREVPAGWREVGVSGTKEECLAHIEKVWVDMRPLSLRKAMSEASAS
jgi:MbtH protein